MVVQAEGAGVRLRDLRHTAEYVKWIPAVAETLKWIHKADVKGLPPYSQWSEAEELQGAADDRLARATPWGNCENLGRTPYRETHCD